MFCAIPRNCWKHKRLKKVGNQVLWLAIAELICSTAEINPLTPACFSVLIHLTCCDLRLTISFHRKILHGIHFVSRLKSVFCNMLIFAGPDLWPPAFETSLKPHSVYIPAVLRKFLKVFKHALEIVIVISGRENHTGGTFRTNSDSLFSN